MLEETVCFQLLFSNSVTFFCFWSIAVFCTVTKNYINVEVIYSGASPFLREINTETAKIPVILQLPIRKKVEPLLKNGRMNLQLNLSISR